MLQERSVDNVKIFTSRTCGWAVRNYAALLEKGVEFDMVCARDATGNRSAEFVEATPFLKTPVLVHGDTRVFESTLINLYIDDCFPWPPLLPDNPSDRIEAHKWIHFSEARLMRELSEAATAMCPDTRRAAITQLGADLDWFGAKVLREEWVGPYFFGEQFSLVDIAFSTVFRTLRQIEVELLLTLTEFQPSLVKWERSIQTRPSIQQAVDIQEHIDF
jgi:glutathione S-transferase